MLEYGSSLYRVLTGIEYHSTWADRIVVATAAPRLWILLVVLSTWWALDVLSPH